MIQKNRIGIDLMGSDHSPAYILDAILDFQDENIDFFLIGTNDVFLQFENKKNKSKFHFVESASFVSMEDNPITAVRRKKDSSMCIGIKMLKEEKINSFLSFGNTGALALYSKIILSSIKPIRKPALMAHLPTKKDSLAIIDVGANISCKAKDIVNFAKMGIIAKSTNGNKIVKVALLNIGSESKKGTHELKKAFKELVSLENHFLNFSFLGNIEGRDVFEGDIDLLVTDGFSGNIFLKAAEGTTKFILDKIKSSCDTKSLQREIIHHQGAILLGVNGVVIKCHSYSSKEAIINGIHEAIKYSNDDLIINLKKYLI